MDKDNKNTKEIIDKAVALSYDPTDIAPRIIAKGQGIDRKSTRLNSSHL